MIHGKTLTRDEMRKIKAGTKQPIRSGDWPGYKCGSDGCCHPRQLGCSYNNACGNEKCYSCNSLDNPCGA
jgi:hypothetical protein